ncbi:MAG: acyltransferase [Proteobacteria bacterium]|nr:acyltransferase [Pseudomonadota bacterium]
MLSFLPGPLKGILAFFLFVVNLLFWFVILIPFALIKICLPVPFIRKPMDYALNFFCTMWASCNKIILIFLNDIKWDIEGNDDLSMNEWYLVLSNHQSYSDFVALQYVLNNRIPYFRFFIKKELLWIPIFNFVWYALDYPRMKRYPKEFLEKNPHLKGKDIETTRKSCERFKFVPVSVMNFVEGTRFTKAKHEKQQSPFKHLLKPKAGGIAFVLAAMGDQLSAILDVTISYSPKAMSLWDFFCGRVSEVKIRVKRLSVSDDVKGDYFEDNTFRERFQAWMNTLWTEKDLLMESMKTGSSLKN